MLGRGSVIIGFFFFNVVLFVFFYFILRVFIFV